MNPQLVLTTVQTEVFNLQLFVPVLQDVQQQYYQTVKQEPAAFPYWAQLWPSSLALATFIARHPAYVHGKEVLELAAGLGLPSLVAAKWAHTVCCSDYQPAAVAVIQQSVLHNQLNNISCKVLDWNALPAGLTPGLLLLSDVNYDPAAFHVLFDVLQQFLLKKTVIIISTPQRLLAKPFIERLLPWCVLQENVPVLHQSVNTVITVLVLQQP